MRRLFAILISAFLVVGFAPLANAATGPALNAIELTPHSLNLVSRFALKTHASKSALAQPLPPKQLLDLSVMDASTVVTMACLI